MAFVEVYNKKTKVKARVPEHWLGHPTLGKDLEVVPSVRERSTLTVEASTSEKDKTKETRNKEDGNAEDHR